jgi:hypothetical protein
MIHRNIIISKNYKHSDMCKASILQNNLKLGNIVQMKTVPVSEAEVINIIKSLKPKNTAGYDGISS